MSPKLRACAIPVVVSAAVATGCGSSVSASTDAIDAIDVRPAAASAPPAANSVEVPPISFAHTRALVVNEDNVVALGVSPEADCVLRVQDGESSGSFALVADDQGEVDFTVHPTTLVAPPVARLDCADEGGTVTRHVVSFTTAPDAAAKARVQESPLSLSPSTQRFLRPALEGDPGAPSIAELVARGYPPRPDAVKNPDQYATWLALVSKPVTLVRSSGRQHFAPSGSSANRRRVTRSVAPAASPATCTQASGNTWSAIWSGFYYEDPIATGAFGDSNGGSPYQSISANWFVPTLGSSTSASSSAAWVGLGGVWSVTGGRRGNLILPFRIADSLNTDADANTTLIQAGTNQDFISLGGSTAYAHYSGWYEYATPTSSMSYFTPTVNGGDQVTAIAWSGDVNGNPNSTGAYGWFYFYDAKTNVGQVTTLAAPASSVGFFGESAEWVMERPPQGGSVPALADYGSIAFTSTDFQQANGSTGTASSAGYFPMTNDVGCVLSQCGIVLNTHLDCWWVAPD